MIKMFPEKYNRKNVASLQSLLFGHRMKSRQTKYEYLIEFLQVAISKKKLADAEFECMFPVDSARVEESMMYYPVPGMGLKRFIFMPHSKIDGKANIDIEAYSRCVKALEDKVDSENTVSKKNSVMIIQNLLNGFSVESQNRSWFDQNLMPICQEVILPEGMGEKKKRKDLSFEKNIESVDYKDFEFNKYTYMCRGGEIYYLHLLNAVNQFPEYGKLIEERIYQMLNQFPQFSFLCEFVQRTWDEYMEYDSMNRKTISKELGAIPRRFSDRNEKTLLELKYFLNSKSHPFEKMEMLANGLLLQLMRLMYNVAAEDQKKIYWVIDVNCKGYESEETKKIAVQEFKHNEECVSNYLYRGFEELKNELDMSKKEKIIKQAADDSYRLFRKLGKLIGIIIPIKGPGMRFSLSEEIIKFLVLSIIPPKSMITLDEFIEHLYDHFGMIIDEPQYRRAMAEGSVKEINDLSFLKDNKVAFSQKLKGCGFLRDLSDATSIVENPYESEDNT